MRCWSVMVQISLQIILCRGFVNYCGARMCGHTDEHTFCRYSRPGLSCTGYIQAPLSSEEKTRIMARLNRRRNDIALGLNDWPPAADMLKLRWVEELSREAQLWADQCRPPAQIEEYDLCRDLYSTTVGQCVASIVGEAPGLRPETMVDIWYMQRISYEGNFTSYTPSTNRSHYYRDFVQMVSSHTYMVGCGRSRFMAPWRGRLRSVERLVCNFAPRGPVFSRALWTLGSPASMCPTRSRPDSHLPGLCSFQVQLNVSDDIYSKFSDEEHILLDTVLDVENNDTHDGIGFLDEYYLKKLAISNMSLTSTDDYNFLYKREIIEELDQEQVNETTIQPMETKSEAIETVSTKIKGKIISTIGRYKSFDLEELEDLNNPENLMKNILVEETTELKELYADFEYFNGEGIYDGITNVLASTNLSAGDINDVQKSNGNITTELFEINTSVDALDVLKLGILPNTSDFSNTNRTNHHEDLDDYFADPETFRQLQEALERMENNLSGPVSTAAKVRRELRTLSPNRTSIRGRENIMTPDELQAEIERNRSTDRGPMLSMVLKYLPYLKPYEKTIMGEVTSNSVTRIMPNVILVILCI